MNRIVSACFALAFSLANPAFVGIALAEVSIDELIAEADLREGPVATRDLDRWEPPGKIIIRGSTDLAAELQRQFPGVEFDSVTSVEKAASAVADADAVIGFCNEEVVSAANRLVWVQVGSAGVERCMATAAIADGTVLLTNMQKMSSPVIGEHAIALMLSLARGLPQQAKAMSSGEWNRRIGDDLGMISVEGRTVLIVGLGGIGKAAAKRASALGMRVVATRNSSREGPDYVDYVGLSDELLDLASEADVVINALPLTPNTRGIFNATFFDAAKRGIIFVNVARGGSVVTDDLVAALKHGRVASAGLDVTDPEPLPTDHELWQLPNVIITPHIAWYGSTGERERALVKENVRRFVAGDALLNVVDPERGY
jgi:phosphoglycerate dehydrogenase-like enzyme